jgi:hypothetical protein
MRITGCGSSLNTARGQVFFGNPPWSRCGVVGPSSRSYLRRPARRPAATRQEKMLLPVSKRSQRPEKEVEPFQGVRPQWGGRLQE